MSPSSPLVITFCSFAYIPVLANFIFAIRNAGHHSIRVYALDEKTAIFGRSTGVEILEIPWDGKHTSLWSTRLEVFQKLIAEGRDFVHSDVDAIWLDDPIPDWMTAENDLTFSQGTIHPRNTHTKLGFVLCCGLFRVCPTKGAMSFFNVLAEDFAFTGDDQASVNNVLFRFDTRWNISGDPDYRLGFKDTFLSCWRRKITGACAAFEIDIAMLPNWAVQRVPDEYGQPLVCHPLTAKNAKKKLQYFEQSDLLYIRNDWEEVGERALLEDYIPKSSTTS